MRMSRSHFAPSHVKMASVNPTSVTKTITKPTISSNRIILSDKDLEHFYQNKNDLVKALSRMQRIHSKRTLKYPSKQYEKKKNMKQAFVNMFKVCERIHTKKKIRELFYRLSTLKSFLKALDKAVNTLSIRFGYDLWTSAFEEIRNKYKIKEDDEDSMTNEMDREVSSLSDELDEQCQITKVSSFKMMFIPLLEKYGVTVKGTDWENIIHNISVKIKE